MQKKMMSMLVHLGHGTHNVGKTTLIWDDTLWDYILEEAPKAGINTIVLDVNDGVRYHSRPEIGLDDAWSQTKLKYELDRIRKAGMTPIPKVNFSCAHSLWQGVYRRMTSTTEYYKFANDIIKEIYEIFDGPEYIHIGMDEESLQYVKQFDYVVCRQGDLYWHDLRFLVDCVKATGATPWIWHSCLFDHPEEFKKHFGPKEILISPYHYNALYREHWTPITQRSEYLVYYNEGEYAKMGIEFVEQDPFLVNFMNVAIPLMKEGYMYAPCASVFNRCDWNHYDLLHYFKENAPDDQIVGYMTAPWFWTEEKSRCYFDESFKFFKEAIDEFYPNN